MIPDNRHHVSESSRLYPSIGVMLALRMTPDQYIMMTYDGEYLRNGNAAWSIDSLMREIDDGKWAVVNA
jgi:hypothetical protein